MSPAAMYLQAAFSQSHSNDPCHLTTRSCEDVELLQPTIEATALVSSQALSRNCHDSKMQWIAIKTQQMGIQALQIVMRVQGFKSPTSERLDSCNASELTACTPNSRQRKHFNPVNLTSAFDNQAAIHPRWAHAPS